MFNLFTLCLIAVSPQLFEPCDIESQKTANGYRSCIRYNLIPQAKAFEDGPTRAEAFTYLFAELNRVQAMIRDEYALGELEAWKAANIMTYTYETLGELLVAAGDINKAHKMMEFGLILQRGTEWEIVQRHKIANLYPTTRRIAMLEKIAEQPSFLAGSRSRGHAESIVAMALARLYNVKRRHAEAVEMMEQYLVWITDNEHTALADDWEIYSQMLKHAEPGLSDKKREKIKKKLVKIVDKRFDDEEYRNASKREEAILARNWRKFLKMSVRERHDMIREMRY